MPNYIVSLEIARPVSELFLFLTQTRNLIQLAPPDVNLELLSAPPVLALGAQLIWKGRRWGIAQQITQVVATFEIEKRIIVEQRKGPFAHWVHTHQFTPTPTGTLLHDTIDFAPPGGLLGRLISADSIRKDLDKLFAFRSKKLLEIFK